MEKFYVTNVNWRQDIPVIPQIMLRKSMKERGIIEVFVTFIQEGP